MTDKDSPIDKGKGKSREVPDDTAPESSRDDKPKTSKQWMHSKKSSMALISALKTNTKKQQPAKQPETTSKSGKKGKKN